MTVIILDWHLPTCSGGTNCELYQRCTPGSPDPCNPDSNLVCVQGRCPGKYFPWELDSALASMACCVTKDETYTDTGSMEINKYSTSC